MNHELCPCHQLGTPSLSYEDCCKPLHNQDDVAKTPEQLMRSRYCAFVKGQYEYLVATHHIDFRSGMTAETLAQGQHPNWLGLTVEASHSVGVRGEVTFKAWYKDNTRIDAIYEHSLFCLKDGRWYYTEGEQFEVKLPKRNDKCVCQSGKKFKQCCMNALK